MSYSILETELNMIARLNREELKSRQVAAACISAAFAFLLGWLYADNRPDWLHGTTATAIIFLLIVAAINWRTALHEAEERKDLIDSIKRESGN